MGYAGIVGDGQVVACRAMPISRVKLDPGQMSAADDVAWVCLAEDGAMSCGMVAALLEAPEDE